MNGPKTGSERELKPLNHPEREERGRGTSGISDVQAFGWDAFACKKQRVTEKVRPLLNSGTIDVVSANPAEI